MAEVPVRKVSRLPQVAVKHLTAAYGEHTVLKDIQLDVHRGEFVSVVGPSGSGKTTLLYALAGFIPATGEIEIPKGIGVVFQDSAVFPWMTVAQNIAFGLKGKAKDESHVVEQHLKLIRLEGSGGKYPAELSGGQIQRVGIARALAADPEVLLMDEPYGSLDWHTREQMQQWLLDVWSANRKTVLFITHDIEEAVFLSDRVLVLSGGTITAEYSVPFDRPRAEPVKFCSTFLQLKKLICDRIKQER